MNNTDGNISAEQSTIKLGGYSKDDSVVSSQGHSSAEIQANDNFEASRFRESFIYVAKCMAQERQRCREEVSQFMEQGYDLLNNDISSVKAASVSENSSFSLAPFMSLNVTNPIHIYNFVEQMCESNQRHLEEEKQLQELRSAIKRADEQKQNMSNQITLLKSNLKLLKEKNEREEKQKTQYQQKYRKYKEEAKFFKSKLDDVGSYVSSRLQ